ncbi:hypothetical protein BH20ACI1_BH20ACI1_02910 [soil metagenome]
MSIANTQSETIFEAGIVEENDQTKARVEHLKELEKIIGNSYPNKFERSHITGKEDTISNIVQFEPVIEIVKELKDNTPEGEKPDQELKSKLNEKLKEFGNVRISGRLAVPPRIMGKAAFVHLSDGKSRLQIYCRKEDFVFIKNLTTKSANNQSADSRLSTLDSWTAFGLLDHGDFIGVEGYLFLTNTGELSVHVETLQFLSKALMPMPDKMHGIVDPELQRRFRYADLIADSLKIDHEEGELTTREVFERRAKLISGMRRFLDDAGFIEVETPMLTPKATGAAAKPFETYHETLKIPLYARIAPELYLKRLTVGGFEKVYELNRNFRNEGLSHKHNPEFTMLEFYCAYMDVNGMMDFAEAMIKESVQKATGGSLQVKYGENEIDFSKFERLTMKKAIEIYWDKYWDNTGNNLNFPRKMTRGNFERNWLDDPEKVLYIAAMCNKMENWETFFPQFNINGQNVSEHPEWAEQTTQKFIEELQKKSNEALGELAEKQIPRIFEMIAETEVGSINNLGKNTIQPTFIIDYPKSISPLSKASPENPNIAERFELFINGMECANGFSELNDPQEQYERFKDQMKERESGDAEAMVLDEDYIRALAYGMPPAAGIGIGIDRLVMLLTNKHSIRDVILFPHMRPEKRTEENSEN